METFVLFMVTFVLMFLLNWSCYTLANVNLCQKGKCKNPLVLAINGTELHCPLRRDVVCLPSPTPYPPFRNPWTLLQLDRGKTQMIKLDPGEQPSSPEFWVMACAPCPPILTTVQRQGLQEIKPLCLRSLKGWGEQELEPSFWAQVESTQLLVTLQGGGKASKGCAWSHHPHQLCLMALDTGGPLGGPLAIASHLMIAL